MSGNIAQHRRSYFYLHFGPGGNCDAERTYLSGVRVNFHFWDQPAARTFSELTDATAAEFDRHFRDKECLGIVGHSFGCDLAVTLANQLAKSGTRLPIILVAPIPNLVAAFENLARVAANQKDMDKSLHEAITEKLRTLSISRAQRQALWDLVYTTYRYANIGRLFWHGDLAFQSYAKSSGAFRPVDLVTWQNVLTDYIDSHDPALSKRNFASIADMTKVCLGGADPYLDDTTGASFWNQLIKDDHILNLSDAGHYVQLEKSRDFIKFLASTDEK